MDDTFSSSATIADILSVNASFYTKTQSVLSLDALALQPSTLQLLRGPEAFQETVEASATPKAEPPLDFQSTAFQQPQASCQV